MTHSIWPLICFTALTLTAGAARAVPALETVEATTDDATVALTARSRFITDDARSECKVELRVLGDGVALSEGDRAIIEVYENDFWGDDPFWEIEYEFTAAEIASQASARTYDCSGRLPGDGNDAVELVARAEVQKGECGFFCAWDRPQTAEISIRETSDDGAEQDDNVGAASALALGRTPDRVGIDQDFFSFELAGPTRVLFQVEHVASVGRLEATLFGSDGDTRLAEGADEDLATVLDVPFLQRGIYYVRIAPRQGGDFNFYDVRFSVAPVQQDCAPGTEESEACGNCGIRTRRCADDGSWGAFGACEGEGACAPGESRSQPCGLCGSRSEVCTELCEWAESEACAEEGECLPGDIDAVPCEGAEQESVRSCDDECMWGAYTSCEGADCESGEKEDCYGGPQGTADVGACRSGTRTCEGGAWGACEGEIRPEDEICDDGEDNDCNGAIDTDDAECGGGAPLGDRCVATADCARPFECVGPPEHPMFVDGYCGLTGCDADCGADAACVRVFGLAYCLERCDRPEDCREGYLCAAIGASRVCTPRCTADSHCRDVARPFCDLSTGRCAEAPGSDLPDLGVATDAFIPPPREDAGRLMPDGGLTAPAEDTAVPAGCACRSAAGGGSPWGWLMLTGGLLLGIRRRRR